MSAWDFNMKALVGRVIRVILVLKPQFLFLQADPYRGSTPEQPVTHAEV